MTSVSPHPKTGVVRQPNGNIEIKLTLPWSDIDRVREIKTREAVSQAEISGFRKGMAPRNLVEPKLDQSELISKALGDLIPQAYAAAVKDNQLKPILYPQVRIDKAKSGEDWEITAVTCESPSVVLGDFKTGLAKITAKPDQSKLSAAIEYLRGLVKITIPEILIEEETNQRLTSLVENITQIGLSMDKYLQTKKLTAAGLKAQTASAAKIDLEVEFILTQIQSDKKQENRNQTLEFIQSLVAQAK